MVKERRRLCKLSVVDTSGSILVSCLAEISAQIDSDGSYLACSSYNSMSHLKSQLVDVCLEVCNLRLAEPSHLYFIDKEGDPVILFKNSDVGKIACLPEEPKGKLLHFCAYLSTRPIPLMRKKQAHRMSKDEDDLKETIEELTKAVQGLPELFEKTLTK